MIKPQSAWQDGQRAVRLVRSEAKQKRHGHTYLQPRKKSASWVLLQALI